jgi:transposase
MQERLTPEAMRLRRCTVEHPFATIKYRIFGHPRMLMCGLSGAKVEIGLATMAYNLKRITRNPKSWGASERAFASSLHLLRRVS